MHIMSVYSTSPKVACLGTFFSELYQGKEEKESKRLRGERGQTKFIDLRCERWQVARFRKASKGQDIP